MSDSLITKNAIAGALKKLCHTKPFDKISIADITGECGLNRQTFYYHFQDKYELLNWILYQEAFKKVTEDMTFDNWHERLAELLEQMAGEKAFYSNAVHNQEESFQAYLFPITHTLLLEAAVKLDEENRLTEEGRDFFARFNAYGICGMVMAWVKDGMKMPPKEVAGNLKALVANSRQLAFDRFER